MGKVPGAARTATAGTKATAAATRKSAVAPKARPAQSAPAQSAPAKTTAPKSTSAKTTPAKTTPAKTPPAKTTPAKTTPAKTTPAKTTPAKTTPAKTTPAKTTPAKTTPANTAPAKTPSKVTRAARAPAAGDGQPTVPAGSDWTAASLADVRADLEADIERMRAEYEQSLHEIDELQISGADGAGDDQADAGSKTFEREQELSIAANRFDLLSQMIRAVERLDQGTYGYCENCGRPIPRARLQAFPMATLDVACKQREERR